MSYVAEILIDHPTQTVIDQVDKLYTRKVVDAADYGAVVRLIAEQRHHLDDPLTGSLAIDLADGRQVRVVKYVPAPEGQTGRIRIEKKTFASPSEEIQVRKAALLAAEPRLTDAQAQA